MPIYKDKIKISQLKEYALLLGVLFLPVYQTINHWFFGLFIFFSLIDFLQKKDIPVNFRLIGRYLLLTSFIFLLLRLMFLFHTTDFKLSQKELTRALPFLLYPLGILSFVKSDDLNYQKFENKVFWALTIGCFITALICWSNVAINMGPNAIPANKFFGWKKSGTYLTALLDLHPPYLGMLYFGSIVFLFRELIYNQQYNKLKKTSIYLLTLFLIVFLFNLTARNSLLFLAFSGFVFFVYKKYWKMILLLLVMVLSAIILIINHPSQYYRIKLYHMLGLSNSEQFQDRRFERLKASYNVFIKKPVFGVGLGKDIQLKILEYEKMGDDVAAKSRFNSHNQFFEYLAAYGIIGGLTFVIGMLSILGFLIRNKFYFYLLVFLNVILASMTESVFERALGIQYFALLTGMVFLKHMALYTQKHLNAV